MKIGDRGFISSFWCFFKKLFAFYSLGFWGLSFGTDFFFLFFRGIGVFFLHLLSFDCGVFYFYLFIFLFIWLPSLSHSGFTE
jgi:hypothetical protein